MLLTALGGALIAIDLTRRRSPSAPRVWAVVALFVILIIGLQIGIGKRR
ncbi:MAG: hypothetical protein ABI647_04730 [Gemmatimonadota bacterium]